MKKTFIPLMLVFSLISCSNITSNSYSEEISNSSSSFSDSVSSEISSNVDSVVATELKQLNNTKFLKLNEGDKKPSLFVEVLYSDNSIKQIELVDELIEGTIDFYKVGTYSFKVNYENLSKEYTINVIEPKSISLSSYTYCNGISKYNTGSFGSFSDSGISMEFYRAYRNVSLNDFTSLIPFNDNVNEGSAPGALYNINPAYQIQSISIEYKSEDGLCLSTGKTRKEMNPLLLPGCSDYTTYTTSIDNDHYFSIETTSSMAYIKNVTVLYSGIKVDVDTSFSSAGENHYRINPITYTNTKVPGESYIDMPIDITVEGNKYIINETKRYTYYSYDYVSKNPQVAESASYVTPIDVANYFIAFGTYPANYVYKKSYNTAYNLFKKNTRCVSDYNRTNGYANYVPYKANSSGKPHYYECDIALDSTYSSSNRGLGRVVIWEYGFSHVGYDASIVAVYTDDHYSTFQEYLNTGKWGERFNAEQRRTAYVWGSAKTLAPAN